MQTTIVRETDDAVSQLQIGRRLELDKGSISQLVDRLDVRGLIDRAPAYPGREYRIYLPAAAARLVIEGRTIVDAVSADMGRSS